MAIHCVRPTDFNRKWIGMVPAVKPKAEKKIKKKIKHGMNACNAVPESWLSYVSSVLTLTGVIFTY